MMRKKRLALQKKPQCHLKMYPIHIAHPVELLENVPINMYLGSAKMTKNKLGQKIIKYPVIY